MRLIFAILSVVLAGGIFFFYTSPTYDKVRVVQAQIDQYNAALDKAAQLQQLKQSLLSRYNAFNPNDLDRLQKLLPDHVDNVRLILDLDNLAARYGLALQNVDVSNSATQTAKSQTAIGAITASSQKYSWLTLKFGTRGTYDTFVRFLNDLESSLRIVDLVSLSISPDSNSSVAPAIGHVASPSEPTYVYDITLRTYWLK
jgi:Tfp pilus assembly protein PilO